MNEEIKDELKDIAVKGAPSETMADILLAMNVTALRKIARGMKVKDAAKLDKAALLMAVYPPLSDKDRIFAVLCASSQHALDCLKEQGTTHDELWLARYSFVVPVLCEMHLLWAFKNNDRFEFVVPREVRAVLDGISPDIFAQNRREVDALHNIALAATNLYGFIRLEELFALFCKYTKMNMGQDEISDLVMFLAYLRQEYDCLDGYLINEDLMPYDDDYLSFDYYIERAGDKERYIPGKEEFLRYADYAYIEPTPQTAAFKEFCRTTLGIPEDEIAPLLLDIRDMIQFGEKVPVMLRLIVDYPDEPITNPQMDTLVKLIQDLHNYTRLWLNKGYTADEMLRLFPPEHHDLELSIDPVWLPTPAGRNDPCPCGSGKKYKKCCGK